MARTLLIIFSVLPQLMLGQYTYFNEGYLPPYPEIGSGGSTNLLLRNDTLFTYGFAPLLKENGRQIYFLDYFGNLEGEWLYPEGNDVFLTDHSDNILPYENGFAWAGARLGHPLILIMNFDFSENFRIEYPNLVTDTTYSTYFTFNTIEGYNLISVGRNVYDLEPEVPGQDFANMILSKHDAVGNEIWFHEYTLQDLNVTDDNLYSIFPRGGITPLSNGEFIVWCTISEPSNCYAFKFDSLGNYIDHVSWGHPTYSDGSAWPVQISENEFRFVYGTYSTGMGEEWLSHPRSGILNTDAMNVQLDTALDHDYIYGQITDFERTPDGGFALLYYGEPDTNGEEFGFAWIIKLDSDGNEEWIQQYAPPEPYDTQTAYDLEITSDDGFAFVGNYHPYDQGVFYYKTWIVKTDACGDLIDAGCEPIIQISELQDKQETLSVYPNPVQDVLTISYENAGIAFLELYDATGRLVLRQKVNDQATQHYINVGELPASLYQLLFKDKNGRALKEIKVLKTQI